MKLIILFVATDMSQRSNNMTREEYKKEIFNEHSSTKVYKSAKKYIKSLEAQLKAKDDAYSKVAYDFESAVMEIELFKKIINTSIEEIKYAIIKPLYAEVYLNNAIRFLRKQQ